MANTWSVDPAKRVPAGRTAPTRTRSGLALALGVALAGALAAPAPALAHEFWIERDQQSGFLLREGHGDAPRAVDLAKVTSLRCARGADVRELRGKATAQRGEARVTAACDAILATLDHGHWSLTPDGEVNRPRSQVPEAVKAWQSRACAKWIDAASEAAARPMGGADLELVLGKRGEVRQGEKVTVRALSAGVPVGGAVVSVGHRVLGETDSAGEVRVRIRERGLQVVSASLRKRLQTPDADALVLEATLAFEVSR